MADQLLTEKAVQLAELEANINGVDLHSNIGDTEQEIEDAMAGDDGSDGGVLEDDLALSANEMEDDEEIMGKLKEKNLEEFNKINIIDEAEWADQLLQSRMHSSGQLNNDLALSDSDDDEHMEAIKRSNTTENLLDSF
uniref:Uncharacterized protein n=1 Tax=Heterorhabditis bacteriophora TaxID=37862 RepID=A0A1I7XMX7_HETBA